MNWSAPMREKRKPSSKVEERLIPTLRRHHRGWRWSRVLGWCLLGVLGAWSRLPWPLGCGLLALSLARLGLLMRTPRWVQVEAKGLRLRYLRREVFLPWESLLQVEGRTLHTTLGRFTLPLHLEDRPLLVRLIQGIVAGEPLMPPRALPQPSWEALKAWFSASGEGERFWLRCPLLSPEEQNVLSMMWTTALFWWLLFTLTDLWPLFLLGVGTCWTALTVACGWLVRRMKYPYRIGLAPEGVELHYLRRRCFLAWSDILHTSTQGLYTGYGFFPLFSCDPPSRRLMEFLLANRSALGCLPLPPPDDARRALSLVAPLASEPTGRELAEPAGERRILTGYELEEGRAQQQGKVEASR